MLKILRYNTKQKTCLDAISFYELHLDSSFSKTSSEDFVGTSTEQTSEYLDWLKSTGQPLLAQYINSSAVQLVFQEHESQETYVLTAHEVWRVRKSDYLLEFGGNTYEWWPYLCTF